MKSIRKRADENSLPQAEWDFSKCPIEELRDCYVYEFTRKLPDVRESVRNWRERHPGKEFDEWLSIAGKPTLLNRPRLFGYSLFNFCPEWPEKPFLSICAMERDRRRKLLPKFVQPHDEKYALRLEHLPRILKESSEPSQMGELEHFKK